MLISHTICHQGLVRDQNEDSFISNDDERVWLVADGVGGNVGGELASQISVQTVERKLRQGSALISAIEEANQSILSVSSEQPELKGMATTIVAVRFHDTNYELAWVGDSRAYIIDANGIHLLSADHNVANELYEKGEITKQELHNHPGQHELTQALGQLSIANIPLKSGELHSDSVMLLCSDGLSGVISEEEILKEVQQNKPIEKILENLLKMVLDAGAPDNVTMTLIQRQAEPIQVENVPNNTTPTSIKIINKAPITWSILAVVMIILMLLFYVD